MRWCFVSPGFRSVGVLSGDSRTSGGAEAQVAHLAAALANRGDEVGLIYGDGRRSWPAETIAGVLCIDAAPAWRRPRSLASFWQAMNLLAPNVLYARLPSDFLWLMGFYARLRPGSHFVYALANDLHGRAWSAWDHRQWFHAPLYGLGLRSAHVITIQHDHQTALVAEHLRHRLAHVPNLVRAFNDTPRPYGETKFDAVWVAKIRPVKRLDLFLDLARSIPDFRFAIIGGFDPTMSDPARAELERRIAASANVTWFGAMRAEKVMDVLRQSRILVNTSEHEGFPNSMLEAWSVGVPVVSLSVDPGGVIERERLGALSRTVARLRDDVMAISRDENSNHRLGSLGLAYVRRRHNRDVVCRALTEALPRAGLLPANA